MYDDKILSNCLTRMFQKMENKIDKVEYVYLFQLGLFLGGHGYQYNPESGYLSIWLIG